MNKEELIKLLETFDKDVYFSHEYKIVALLASIAASLADIADTLRDEKGGKDNG